MFDHGWLQTAHSFSFADYHEPAHMGFRSLRVINEDHIAPGAGFGTHPHRDMEILTWVLAGAIAHRDSMGHDAVLGPDQVQIMSAGTGIAHSEYNASTVEPLHLLQVWILPERSGLEPRYDQQRVDPAAMHDRLLLLAAPRDQDPLVTLHQDASVWAGALTPGHRLEHVLAAGRGAWVQVTSGTVMLGETTLGAGDGAAVLDETTLPLRASEPSRLLLFDLA